jgi:hypothetical protein
MYHLRKQNVILKLSKCKNPVERVCLVQFTGSSEFTSLRDEYCISIDDSFNSVKNVPFLVNLLLFVRCFKAVRNVGLNVYR